MADRKEDLAQLVNNFTPLLTTLVNDPLYSRVWSRSALSPRDRSLVTIAALVALYRPGELPMHLEIGLKNGLTKVEISELITHLAFYAGFPASITASGIAYQTLGALDPEAT